MQNIFMTGQNPDPLLNQQQFDKRIDELIQMRDALQRQEMRMQQIQQRQPEEHPENNTLFSDIENEAATLTQEQQKELLKNELYVEAQNELQAIINAEIMQLIRPRVLSNSKAVEYLKIQLNAVRGVKKRIAEENERVLSDFREYTTKYPNISYQEYLQLKNGKKNDSDTSKGSVTSVE